MTNFGYGCACGKSTSNCGCGVARYSIDSVTGLPIYIENFVLPVFKGSTLITEFQFPSDLLDTDVVTVVQGSPVGLNSGSVLKVGSNLVAVRWEASLISTLNEADENTCRIQVENTVTGIIKVYNQLTILLV